MFGQQRIQTSQPGERSQRGGATMHTQQTQQMNAQARQGRLSRWSGAGLATLTAATLALGATGASTAWADDDPLPDCTVTSISAPATATVGQPIAVKWTVLNKGGGPVTTAYFDAVAINTRPVFDGGAALLGTYNIQASVSSNANYTEDADFRVPQLAPGQYYLVVRTDYFFQLPESDHSNNDLAIPLTIVAN